MAELERKWYVIKSVTGTEKKVKQNIDSEVALSNLKDSVFEVLIPTEKVFHSTKNGKKVVKERNYFPSYIFVEAIMTQEVCAKLLEIPGVLGFVGCKRKSDPPVALRKDEVNEVYYGVGRLKVGKKSVTKRSKWSKAVKFQKMTAQFKKAGR